MVNPITRGLGWKPALPQHIASTSFTDVGKFGIMRAAPLPRETNNRACNPLIRDQSGSNMCTGFGFTGAAHSRLKILGFNPPPFAPRLPYTVGRMLARSSRRERLIDDGAYPDLVAMGIMEFGFVPETQFPFTDDPEAVNEEPDLLTLSRASQFLLQNFTRIAETGEHRARAVMEALSVGHLVPLGMMVGSKFMDHKGDFPLDLEDQDTIMGGHMTYLIDYEGNGEVFWGVNSYGTGYGYKGLYQITRRRLMHPTTSDLFDMVVIP